MYLPACRLVQPLVARKVADSSSACIIILIPLISTTCLLADLAKKFFRESPSPADSSFNLVRRNHAQELRSGVAVALASSVRSRIGQEKNRRQSPIPLSPATLQVLLHGCTWEKKPFILGHCRNLRTISTHHALCNG